MCVTDRHDTTITVKVALNPNTNQPFDKYSIFLKVSNYLEKNCLLRYLINPEQHAMVLDMSHP